MNYREKMREYIECPQFGSIDYGKWGSLNLEQRKLIKRLLDEMDRADEVIKKQFFELNKQKEVLNRLKVVYTSMQFSAPENIYIFIEQMGDLLEEIE